MRKRIGRWGFSLQTMMVALTLACLVTGWLGWGINERRRHDELVSHLQSRGYEFHQLPFESNNCFSPVAWLGLFDSRNTMQVVSATLVDRLPAPADLLALSRFPELYHLSVRRSELSPACLEAISRLTQLRSLDLIGCEIPPVDGLDGIKCLKSLVKLNLAGTQLEDGDLRSIQGCVHLASLCLNGCQITDEGAQHLKALAGLRRLDLRNTGISDAGLSPIAGLRELLYLDVAETGISGAGIADLQIRLPHLFVAKDGTGSPQEGVAVVTTEMPQLTDNLMIDVLPANAG